MSKAAKTGQEDRRPRTAPTHGPLLLVLLGAAAVGGLAIAVTQAPARAQNPAMGAGGFGQKNDETDPTDVPAPTAARAPSPTVKIVFKIIPPTRATITWGKKKLGLIKPKDRLVIERPRDSGPLDVVVRAEGCIPVHTRAYTFTDSTVAVKVATVDKKNTIFGYREAPPPDVDVDGGATSAPGNPDAGVVPAP